jgi:hypothetical protein
MRQLEKGIPATILGMVRSLPSNRAAEIAMHLRHATCTVLAWALAAVLAPHVVIAQEPPDDFPIVVTEILQSQTTGPLSLMPDEKRLRMIECVNTSLADLPEGKKDYISEGATLEERERRFGVVIYENHAEWLQNIAGACAALAF